MGLVSIDDVESFIAEEKEKAKRCLNIIVHQVPESTATEGPTRKQEDIQQVTSIFEEYLGVNISIQRAFRLGSKDENPVCLKLFFPLSMTRLVFCVTPLSSARMKI